MTKNFWNFFNAKKWPKIYFFFRKIFNTKKWPKHFLKIFEKIENFPDLPLDFFKKYFFWSYQLLWKFFWRKLRCIWPVFKESGMCYYTASYLKSQFCRPGVFFGPFWTLERRKRAKKVNRQTSDKKNYRQKKRTNAGYFVEKKSWLYDNYPQSYIRLLLLVFFVPTR